MKMNERLRKFLLSLAYRTIAVAVIFAVLWVLREISKPALEKVSAVWTKNTDIKRAAELLSELMRMSVPF